MISWSQNGIKMQSSYLLILYSGISTSEFLPGSLHHLGRVPGYYFPGLIYTQTIFYVLQGDIPIWSKRRELGENATIILQLATNDLIFPLLLIILHKNYRFLRAQFENLYDFMAILNMKAAIRSLNQKGLTFWAILGSPHQRTTSFQRNLSDC